MSVWTRRTFLDLAADSGDRELEPAPTTGEMAWDGWRGNGGASTGPRASRHGFATVRALVRHLVFRWAASRLASRMISTRNVADLTAPSFTTARGVPACSSRCWMTVKTCSAG